MTMSPKQVKEKIRYLSDKMENLYKDIEPVIKEFELTRIELEEVLKIAEDMESNE